MARMGSSDRPRFAGMQKTANHLWIRVIELLGYLVGLFRKSESNLVESSDDLSLKLLTENDSTVETLVKAEQDTPGKHCFEEISESGCAQKETVDRTTLVYINSYWKGASPADLWNVSRPSVHSLYIPGSKVHEKCTFTLEENTITPKIDNHPAPKCADDLPSSTCECLKLEGKEQVAMLQGGDVDDGLMKPVEETRGQDTNNVSCLVTPQGLWLSGMGFEFNAEDRLTATVPQPRKPGAEPLSPSQSVICRQNYTVPDRACNSKNASSALQQVDDKEEDKAKEHDKVEDKAEEHDKVTKEPTDEDERAVKDEPPGVVSAQASNTDGRQPLDKGGQLVKDVEETIGAKDPSGAAKYTQHCMEPETGHRDSGNPERNTAGFGATRTVPRTDQAPVRLGIPYKTEAAGQE